MDSFFESLASQRRGQTDLASLSAKLQSLLTESPTQAEAAARALDAAHRSGAIPATEYRALLSLVDRTLPRPVVTVASRPAEGTRLRAVTAPSAAPDVPHGAATSVPDTDHRLGDPHTWTQVGEEPLFVGRVLGRHYQLERKIGEGGMGIVYLAKDLVEADFSEQPFLAIKVLKPDFREHPDALRAMHEEVRKSRTLSHPNIVSVYTFDRDATVVFMTMEYLEGKPLSTLIDEDYARGMPFEQAWPILEGAGRALAYAHDRGVVHSDFKPSNVFVTAGGRAKVLDFGIARAMRQSSSKRFDASSLGALTEAYASCEMLAGQNADPRDDVYAFACVVHEVLTGRHVFGGASAREAREHKTKVVPVASLTKAQNQALQRALVFDREKRSKSIEELLEGLRYRAQPNRGPLLLLIILLGAAVVAVGSWFAVRFVNARNEDQAFVTSLVKPNAESNSNVDPETVSFLTEQGDGYLSEAKRHFDPALLSEGVSTAYGAYRSLLRLDPANRPAAERILEIVKIYEAQARALGEEEQYKRALAVVGYGLKIDPNRSGLKALKMAYEEKARSEPDRAP